MSKVTFKGAQARLMGDLSVGDVAPQVEVVGKDLSAVTVGGAKGKIQILVSVPSLDTGVCATETRKFNQSVAEMGDVSLVVISMDLPFAMGRFCSTEGIENVVVGSDFRGCEFGKAYGVILNDCPLAGLLARAVFIVGKDGKIAYKQIVSEITSEPDYDDIKKALAKLA